MCYLILRLYSNFIRGLNPVFYLFIFFPFSESPVAFSCHVPLISFNLEAFLSFSLYYLNLTLLKGLGQLFCRTMLLKSSLLFPHDYFQVVHFW